MFTYNNFKVSDENYYDNIRTNPLHYNSMRNKPTYPPTLLDINMSTLKVFPNKWMKTKDEWKYFRNETQFRKRCLFTVNGVPEVHLRTVDSLTNRHLLDSNIKYPEEDHVHQEMGIKRVVFNKRNEIEEKSPGDKSYKIVEYSNEFFKKKNRNWRSEKYEPVRNVQEVLSNDLLSLLNIDPASMFSAAKSEFGYEPRPEVDKQEDENDVKNLDNFKKALPLELPFKVLDLADKTIKYRPKVTR